MEYQEASQFVIEHLARHCGLEPWAITPSSRLQEDIGLDSVDAAELLIVLEQETGQRFELEGMEDMETVDAITRRLVESTAAVAPVPSR